MTAVVQNGLALKFASQAMKSDREVVCVAMVSNQRTDMRVSTKDVGDALAYAAEDLRGDNQIVLAAVSCYGIALEHASAALRAYNEIVLIAVVNCGDSL